MRHNLRLDRWSSTEEEDVNPMEGVANLADAMLVLAVGILLALVVAWNVDIQSAAQKVTPTTETYNELTDSNGEDGQTPDELGLVEYGTVYQDANGEFYVVEDPNS